MPAETEKFWSFKLTLFKNTVCVAITAGQKNFLEVLTQWAARCHSWYSNLSWAGQSGNQILVGARFSLLSRFAPGPTQPPVQWILVLSRGYIGQSMVLITHLVLGCEWVRTMPPPPLCAAIGMSSGDLYLYLTQCHFYTSSALLWLAMQLMHLVNKCETWSFHICVDQDLGSAGRLCFVKWEFQTSKTLPDAEDGDTMFLHIVSKCTPVNMA